MKDFVDTTLEAYSQDFFDLHSLPYSEISSSSSDGRYFSLDEEAAVEIAVEGEQSRKKKGKETGR